MPLTDLIKKIDEADEEIRNRLKSPSIGIGEKNALEKARDLIQEALTSLLKYV